MTSPSSYSISEVTEADSLYVFPYSCLSLCDVLTFCGEMA